MINSNMLESLDLWSQILIQNKLDTKTKLKLASVSKNIKDSLIYNKQDKKLCELNCKEGWYHTNRNFELIADDSDSGCELYGYYDEKYKSALMFFNKYLESIK